RLSEGAAPGEGAAGGSLGQRQSARQQGGEGGAAGAGAAGELPALPAGVQPGAERDRGGAQAGQAPGDPPAESPHQGAAPRSGRTWLRPVSKQTPDERWPTTTAGCLALLGRPVEALAGFDQLLGAAVTDWQRVQAHGGRALALARLGRHAEASQALEEVR